MGKNFIGICHDPGGARAILPVLEKLKKNRCRVTALVSGPAVAIAKNEYTDLTSQKIDDSCSLQKCTQILEQYGCDSLISAAGLYNRIEHTMRLAAQQIEIPVVAVLDWWSFYRNRFERINSDGSRVKSYPDKVCVMDDISRKEMIAAGFLPEKIIVAGSVSLESSANRTRQYCKTKKKKPIDLKLRKDSPCAVFFSEPYIRKMDGKPWKGIGGYFTQNGSSKTGYTAHEMLLEVSSALSKQLSKMPGLTLIVKPHPMESISSLQKMLPECSSEGLSVKLAKCSDPAELLATADIFFGMVSIALVEAGMTGKPVYSVQIGLNTKKRRDTCVANRLGLSILVTTRNALEKALNLWAAKKWRCSTMKKNHWQGAAARVAKVILRTKKVHSLKKPRF